MRVLLAESIGTFGLVFCGTSAIVVNDITGGALGNGGIALVFGLIVFAMVMLFASISGAHLNPAVTLGLATSGRVKWSGVPPHIGAQLVGALLASLCVKALFPASDRLGATIPSGDPTISFALEAVMTFLLMLVVLVSSRRKLLYAAWAIGGTVGLEALLGGPISGASMNPVRSLAPALLSGHLEHLWIYMAAPVLGALIAVPVHQLLLNAKHEAGA